MSKNTFAKFAHTQTAKLAATYLAIIMLMSLSFSVMIYKASANQLGRPIPSTTQELPSMDTNIRPFNEEVRKAVEKRFAETRDAVLLRLVWLNLGVLIVGSAVSYLLARRSLRPIEEAMDAQTQFVSDASHELRTPLTVLQTTNEVALRKKNLKNSEARELIAHNVDEVKKLKDLSDSLLNLLKTSDKEVALSRINLQDVINEALPHIVRIAQQKNIMVEDEVPSLFVYSNKVLLARIITILLDNAVKYSEDSKPVKLIAKKIDGHIQIDVVDQGIGIKASDVPHLFRRFYRADKSRSGSDTPGYGLGLSIADKTAKQMGVKIKVISTIGEGSTFSLRIPTA